jgi:hypothetical protein
MSGTPVHIEPSRRVLFDVGATFANGATLSGVVNMRGYALRSLYVPSGFQGTTVTFKASPSEVSANNDGKLLVVRDDAGNVVSVTVAAGNFTVFGTEVAEKLNAMGDFIVLVAGSAQNVANGITVTLARVASTK